MTSFFSSPKTVLVFLILILLPFFEGGETATGLFLIHSLTLLLALVLVLGHSRISRPRFLLFFLPFFLTLCVSFLIAPYRYSAFLKFWDYSVAAIFAVSIFSVFRDTPEKGPSLLYPFFLAISFSLILSQILSFPSSILRIHGAFLSPNDFALYSLLALVLGLYLYEYEHRKKQKLIIVFCLIVLTLFIALGASRGTFIAAAIFAVLYIRKSKRPKYVIAAIGVGLLLSGAFLYYRFSQNPDPYSYYRLRIWKHSLQGILIDPYLGVGLNMLPYNAARFNFPADTEIGRFAKIARSADNQYLQLLAETGFLGFFTFLVGWCALYYFAHKLPVRFRTLADSVLIVSIAGFFSLPVDNTAILFLFLFLICVPMAMAEMKPERFVPGFAARILASVVIFLLLSIAVFLPYLADREFGAAQAATDSASAKRHLDRAQYLNPFQPYYNFAFVKRVVDSGAKLDDYRLIFLVRALNESIELNPLEPEFYLYRARVYRTLFDRTHHFNHYSLAVSSYQAALDRSPFNVFFRTELASYSAQMGRYDIAQSELLKVLEAEPAFLRARLLLVQVRLNENNVREARREFETFEQYYNRYHDYVSYENTSYVRNLLTIDTGLMEDIRQALFSR